MLIEHTHELRVRYDETDPMGLVHHSNYLKYFEIGRTELLRASGGNYRDMESAGCLVVVVRVDCRYKSPAKYDDWITITTTVRKVTMAKIIHHYTIRRGETVLVEADVTLAVIDREGHIQPIPSALQEAFQQHQNSQGRSRSS